METPPPFSSQHADELRAEELQERIDRFLPRGRDAWQQAEDEGYASLAEWIEARQRIAAA